MCEALLLVTNHKDDGRNIDTVSSESVFPGQFLYSSLKQAENIKKSVSLINDNHLIKSVIKGLK